MSRIDPNRNLAHHGLGVFAQCMSDLIGPLAREEPVPSGCRVDGGDYDKGLSVGGKCIRTYRARVFPPTEFSVSSMTIKREFGCRACHRRVKSVVDSWARQTRIAMGCDDIAVAAAIARVESDVISDTGDEHRWFVSDGQRSVLTLNGQSGTDVCVCPRGCVPCRGRAQGARERSARLPR